MTGASADADRAGGPADLSRDASQPEALIPSADFLADLRTINGQRVEAWAEGRPSDPLFWAIELGGEVGEILNVVKKLRREEIGWRGSRASVSDLADEIADGLICLDSLARHYGIDLATATAAKFNKTSDKVGLPHKLYQPEYCDHCGAGREARSPLCAPPFDVQPHEWTGKHPADKRRAAQAIEARRAETGTGSVHESAVPVGDAP